MQPVDASADATTVALAVVVEPLSLSRRRQTRPRPLTDIGRITLNVLLGRLATILRLERLLPALYRCLDGGEVHGHGYTEPRRVQGEEGGRGKSRREGGMKDKALCRGGYVSPEHGSFLIARRVARGWTRRHSATCATVVGVSAMSGASQLTRAGEFGPVALGESLDRL